MKLTRHSFLSYKITSVEIKRVVYFMKIRNMNDPKDVVEIVKCQPEKGEYLKIISILRQVAIKYRKLLGFDRKHINNSVKGENKQRIPPKKA